MLEVPLASPTQTRCHTSLSFDYPVPGSGSHMYLKKRFHLCYQRTVFPARRGRDFISNIAQSVWCTRTFSLRRSCRRALVAIASCESVDLRRPKLALLYRRGVRRCRTRTAAASSCNKSGLVFPM